jgi:hypothetical protein
MKIDGMNDRRVLPVGCVVPGDQSHRFEVSTLVRFSTKATVVACDPNGHPLLRFSSPVQESASQPVERCRADGGIGLGDMLAMYLPAPKLDPLLLPYRAPFGIDMISKATRLC